MTAATPDELWAHHDAAWRDPAQVISHWESAAHPDPQLMRYTTRGRWWELLAAAGITLLVTREYEHLVMALTAGEDGSPAVSYMRLPHPSGLAVDRARGRVHIASTRNPNQIIDLAPAVGLVARRDMPRPQPRPQPQVQVAGRPLVPTGTRFLPGCLYIHDLAMVGGVLHANAVGHNAVVRLGDGDGGNGYTRAWWPRCIEREGVPVFEQNHLQLNSIAAGSDLASSYFSASTDKLSARRPGHKNFPVDGRGVIFSGDTRETIARGLTRPHSARRHGRRTWVDNSGYGELGIAEDGGFTPVARLPGWTRGLCFHEGIAFVGTSRVIPRFRQYAPGLDVDASRCGIHALDTQSGRVLGSLLWPYGNQVFAVEWVPREFTHGFPFSAKGKRASARARERQLFYAFEILEDFTTEGTEDTE